MLTLSAVAEHKAIVLETLEVDVGCHVGNGSNRSMKVSACIKTGDRLSTRERTILLNSAKSCEVGKMMTGNVDIEYRIENGNMGSRWP